MQGLSATFQGFDTTGLSVLYSITLVSPGTSALPSSDAFSTFDHSLGRDFHECSMVFNTTQGFQFCIKSLLCLQAQAHYPVVDVFSVSAYLDKLADECKRRMSEANASTDLQGLPLLNQLMLNSPADGR